MTNNIVIGIIILISALSGTIFLLLFCRSIINKISEKKITRLEDIIKEVYRGRIT